MRRGYLVTWPSINQALTTWLASAYRLNDNRGGNGRKRGRLAAVLQNIQSSSMAILSEASNVATDTSNAIDYVSIRSIEGSSVSVSEK